VWPSAAAIELKSTTQSKICWPPTTSSGMYNKRGEPTCFCAAGCGGDQLVAKGLAAVQFTASWLA
jgi:hypothetical protein